MNILVTGGAGYVGSHAAKLLGCEGHEIWVYDNLVFGHRPAVAPGRLIEGDLLDRAEVEEVLREKRIDAVMHFAAFAYVGESVTDPAKSTWERGRGERARGHPDLPEGDRPSHSRSDRRAPCRRSTCPRGRSRPGIPRPGLEAATSAGSQLACMHWYFRCMDHAECCSLSTTRVIARLVMVRIEEKAQGISAPTVRPERSSVR